MTTPSELVAGTVNDAMEPMPAAWTDADVVMKAMLSRVKAERRRMDGYIRCQKVCMGQVLGSMSRIASCGNVTRRMVSELVAAMLLSRARQ